MLQSPLNFRRSKRKPSRSKNLMETQTGSNKKHQAPEEGDFSMFGTKTVGLVLVGFITTAVVGGGLVYEHTGVQAPAAATVAAAAVADAFADVHITGKAAIVVD